MCKGPFCVYSVCFTWVLNSENFFPSSLVFHFTLAFECKDKASYFLFYWYRIYLTSGLVCDSLLAEVPHGAATSASRESVQSIWFLSKLRQKNLETSFTKSQVLKCFLSTLPSSGLKGVFEKLCFCNGLVWKIGLTWEIKLGFQIPLASYGRALNRTKQ